MVQIALLASVILWSTTRTWVLRSTLFLSASRVETFVYTNGYRTVWKNQSEGGGGGGTYFDIFMVNPDAAATRILIETFDADRPTTPGSAVLETEERTIVWLEHWALCLTCFILTLLTWPRSKTAKQSEASE